MRRWPAGLAALLVAFTGLGPPAAAADDCAAPSRLYAVDANTGHLAEVIGCPDPAALTVGVEVDTGDWRGLRVFASRAGDVTVVYSLAPGGPLEARRQDAPGAPLGEPVQVGGGIDWSAFPDLVSAGAGYLAAFDADTVAHVFRHDGWDTGGTTVVEGPPPFPGGSAFFDSEDTVRLTAFSTFQRARGVIHGRDVMIFRRPDGSGIAFMNGRLPASDPVPVGRLQYGTSGGTIVQLRHLPHPPVYPGEKSYSCPVNPAPWEVATRLPGAWTRVVAPETGGAAADGWPAVQSTGWTWGPNQHCPLDVDPYEWQ